MCTMQSNSSSRSTQSVLEPTGVQNPRTAQNEGNPSTPADIRQNAEIMLRFDVDEPKIGYSSANLAYWAFEMLKSSYLRQAKECDGPDDEDYELSFANAVRLQELQNTLFDEVCSFADTLAKRARNYTADE